MIFFSHHSTHPKTHTRQNILSFVLILLLSALPVPLLAATTSQTPNSKEDAGILPVDKARGQQAIQFTRFDSSMTDNHENNTESPGPINELIQDIQNLEQEYLEELQDRRSSYGIYAVGKFDNDFENSETQYSAGLKWRVFNDGYYEAIRNDAKKILQTQLEFYQLRRDMIDRQLEDDLFKLFTFENMLNMTYYLEKKGALESLLQKRAGQLQHGYTTEIDVLDIRQQLKKTANSLVFYQKSDWAEIPTNKASLFNQLEIVNLKPLSDLIELTKTNSFNLKIQENLTERSNFFPSWVDDVTFNIDAEHKKEFYEKNRSIIGFEVEVPLTFDTNRDSLIETQQRIYKYQKQAITYRLHQRLEKLFSFYQFQQHRLLAQQDDIEILLLKTEKAVSKETNIIQQLDSDPARNLDLLTIELIDTRFEALRTRLKIYEIILKVMTLTQATEITTLFEFD